MISLELIKHGENVFWPECQAKPGECPFTRSCAQHETAGDWRIESGDRPALTLFSNGTVVCHALLTDHTGTIVLVNGEFIPSEEYYGEQQTSV